jgi:hypothetical protein
MILAYVSHWERETSHCPVHPITHHGDLLPGPSITRWTRVGSRTKTRVKTHSKSRSGGTDIVWLCSSWSKATREICGLLFCMASQLFSPGLCPFNCRIPQCSTDLHLNYQLESIIFWDMTPCSPYPTFRRNVSPPSSGSKNSSANHRVRRWQAYMSMSDLPIEENYVGFEVSTAVVMKSIIFWDMTRCSPLSSTRRSSETSGVTQRTNLAYC